MKIGIQPAEVQGFCESRWENDEKAKALKNQIKAISNDSGELTGITATDFEVSKKDLNKLYKHYCDERKRGDEESDFFALAALLETAMETATQDGGSDPTEED